MNRTTSAVSRLCAVIALSLFAGSCGGGGETANPDTDADTGANPLTQALRVTDRDADEDETSPDDATEDDRSEPFAVETVAAVIDEDWPVDVVIPEGWHVENNILGVVQVQIRDHDDQGMLSGEPGDRFSIFTMMEFDTGCDGTCVPNDWEARLNGPDGWLTDHRNDDEIVRDEAIPGGWVIVEDDRGDLELTVLRWDDGAPRYLECVVEIDDDDVALLDQFIDACAAAVPLWFDG